MPCAASEPASKPGRPHETKPVKSRPAMRLYVRHGDRPRVLQGPKVTPFRIAAMVLIVAGVLALAYGGFSFTKETHKAEIRPLKLSVQEKEQVNVPQWA